MADLVADVMYWVITAWVVAIPAALVGVVVWAPMCGYDEEMDDAVYTWRMAQEDGDAPLGDDMELFHEWWAEQVKVNPSTNNITDAF